MYCVVMCDCPPCPSSPFPPVLAELQQADLITKEDCKVLSNISGVVDVQKGKSPEVMSKTAEVLRRHGFEKKSRLLAGRQSRPSSNCHGLFDCYLKFNPDGIFDP